MSAQTITITRRIEFDAGHRVPDHDSQCRNLHGHRYVLEATVAGDVQTKPGDPENGMITDYGALRHVMQSEVAEKWDHAFLVHKDDHTVVEFLKSIPGHKTVILDVVPTAENLVALAMRRIRLALAARYGDRIVLKSVRLYETPNCWADAYADR
jgi:6-pyruvoyltetrahydropterin/6-carboxytetrahydropterin synthase